MIGSKIRELRKARKLSQEDLAEKISEISGESISRQSLSGWETGTVQPRTANLQAAAQALGVPLSALLDDGEAPMPSDVTPLSVPRGRMISVPLLSREVTACCGAGIPTYDEIQNAPDEIYRFRPAAVAGLGAIVAAIRPSGMTAAPRHRITAARSAALCTTLTLSPPAAWIALPTLDFFESFLRRGFWGSPSAAFASSEKPHGGGKEALESLWLERF